MGIKIYLCLLVMLLGLAGCGQREEAAEETNPSSSAVPVEETSTQEKKIGESMVVTRALAAKMLSLTQYSLEEIHSVEPKELFEDVSKEEWYYDFVYSAQKAGLMQGAGGYFRPMDPLTLKEAKTILEDISQSKNKIKLDENNQNQPVSLSLWTELLVNGLQENLQEETLESQYGIVEKTPLVFATPGNSSAPSWTMITDLGSFTFAGYAMDAYADTRIRILEKDGEVFGLLSVTNFAPVLEGAYVVETGGFGFRVFYQGAERTYPYQGQIEESLTGICDLKVREGQVKAYDFQFQQVTGTIKKVQWDRVELEGAGEILSQGSYPVYHLSQDMVEAGSVYDLICGSSTTVFYLKDGLLRAAVITSRPVLEKIRVVLSDTAYQTYYHPSVAVSCTGSYQILGENTEQKMEAGAVYDTAQWSFGETGRIYVIPDREEDVLEVRSISRSDRYPQYRGILEIEKTSQGYVIINELPFEQYLWAVVPSEMPTSYGLEAAKVQAVTARSYGYNQFYANHYCWYGANVDDSTRCQVYNLVGETDVSIEAVTATQGQYLTYQGEVISANFFSTSAGVTANAGEVWAQGGKTFPSETPAYLTANRQYQGQDYGSLYVEENCHRFFKETEIDSIEKTFPFFRWQVSFTWEQLRALVEKNLLNLYQSNPYLVKTLDSDGAYRSKPLEKVGVLQDISVVRRGAGGNVMELCVKTDTGTYLVQTEYLIRCLLKPQNIVEGQNPVELVLCDGSVYQDYSLLPSAFFVLEKSVNETGNPEQVILYGGGNGHGVGMSQNGVKAMCDQGYGYEDILAHYYQDTEVIRLEA